MWVDENLNRYSTSPTIREMPIEPPLEIPPHTHQVGQSQNPQITSVRQDVEKLEPSPAPLVGMQNAPAAVENSLAVSEKVKHKRAINLGNFILGIYLPKRNESIPKNSYTNVHGSMIHKNQVATTPNVHQLRNG